MSRATTERVEVMQIHDANLKHNGNWSHRSGTSEIILHHAEARHASVEDINQWHLERGWAGIGYNYYVRKDGTIWRGRPEWAVGAHAKGHNDKSIGICCEGAYMTEHMPAAQLAALKDLIRDIMSRYGKLKLLRHKDVNETDCPGTNFPWAEVQKYNTETTAKKEETKMTDKEFAAYEERYQAEKANQKPHPYAAEAWQAATDAGIMDGTKPQSPVTREQLAVILQRLGLLGKGVK